MLFDTKKNALKLISKKIKIALLPIVLCLITVEACKQTSVVSAQTLSGKSIKSNKHLLGANWADSLLKKMSLDDKVGQLFMVAAYSNRDEAHKKEILDLITKEKIGGLIFFQGGPVRQAAHTNLYQSKSEIPLMLGMDAEWGLGMRLDSTISFPKQMALGSIQDNKLIYQMGEQIALDCKRLGVHVNFAPVVDVNVNPANPIIGVRSFGENKDSVAVKGIAYMNGLQDNNVLANAKHFPGHGDTDMDSHLSLPIIPHDKARLESVEQYPFKKLFDAGLKSIMVAHVHMPAYDNRKNQATTLSKKVVTDLLKDELKFKGLIFTDALNMKGVASFYEPGEVDLEAFLAGNDVLLFSENVPLAKEKILHAIKKGKISEQELNRRVKKILMAKYWAGISRFKPIKIKNIIEDLNTPKAIALREKLYQKSFVTLSEEVYHLIPREFDRIKIASISVGNNDLSTLENYSAKYTRLDQFQIKETATKEEFDALVNKVKGKYDLVYLSLHKEKTRRKGTMKFLQPAIDFAHQLYQKENTILSVLGNPYTLGDFQDCSRLIYGPLSNRATQKILAQIHFGALGTNGKLPVTTGAKFKAGSGVVLKPLNRLGYTLPENMGMDSKMLQYVDSIALESIYDTATPGCQVIIARRGSIVYNKSFGYHTYNNKRPVDESTIYDLASVTKIVAALPSFMFLEERGEIDVNKKMSEYLTDLKGTNKEDLVIKNILAHQAGLVGYLQHWKKTTDKKGLSSFYYCDTQKDSMYCNTFIPGLYTMSAMNDSLWSWTIGSSLLRKKENEEYGYKYSDLTFYMVQRVVEKLLNQKIDQFVDQNFYFPMGMTSTGYLPLEDQSLYDIAPTEWDSTYRNQLVWGSVHDQGAAMMGGVAGHAGVFSNGNDLAKILQMYLNGGTYGGKKYLRKGTVAKFAAKQFDGNRRGLGFDKPEPRSGGPTSQLASKNTFGHTGFTGIGAWVDPDFDLIFIFLSNRIHPDASNRKLISYNIRTRIHDVIYESIFEYEKNQKVK